MRREAAGWWNFLPDGSYNSSKWFAQAIADEVSRNGSQASVISISPS